MIKKVRIEELRPAYYNPRVSLTEGDSDYKKLRQSIEKFGYVEPIVWNERTGNVVGGHQRLQVLKDMGEQDVYVEVVNLSERDEKQLNLALNKVKGKWDYKKLESILKEFSYDEIGYTGFSADEVAILFQDEDDIVTIEDFEWDEDTTRTNKSCVITLRFKNAANAKNWADEHGYEGQIKPGTRTTVIRCE